MFIRFLKKLLGWFSRNVVVDSASGIRSAIRFKEHEMLRSHLQSHSICVESLENLGKAIIEENNHKNVSGEFSLIAEGYGSSTKLRFTVFRGQGSNSPIVNYFLRIPHDPDSATEQLKAETDTIATLNYFDNVYMYLPRRNGRPHTVFHDASSKEIEVGVFSWAGDRNSRPMHSLDALLSSKLGEQTISNLCAALEDKLKTLAVRFQNGYVNQEFWYSNSLPPDEWMEINEIVESSGDGLLALTVKDVLISDDKTIFCLSIATDESEYWIAVDQSSSANIKKGQTIKLPRNKLNWIPYRQILEERGFLSQDDSFGNREIRDYKQKVRTARRHSDLHPGNLLVSVEPASSNVDVLIIDFCDVEENALLLTDFAFLTFTLCLAFAEELSSKVSDVCQLMKGVPINHRNGQLMKVFLAIKRAQDSIAEDMPKDEIAFTYWYVAHRYLRYVLLSERSDEYKHVVRSWMDFWNPKKSTKDHLTSLLFNYADSMAKIWENEQQKARELVDDERIYDPRRLDCHVDPVLAWRKNRAGDETIYEELKRSPDKQPLEAFERCRAENRWLVITEGGGAGKSVLAMKLASALSSTSQEHGLPYLVYFWESKLPADSEGNLPDQFWKCFLLDARYQKQCKNESLFKFALSLGRVVVVLDGYDELTSESQRLFEQGINSTNDLDGKSLQDVHWVVTGRQYAFDPSRNELKLHNAHRADSDRAFFLRIEPFSEKQQDLYFKRAGIGKEWRNALRLIRKEDQNRLVSLPQTLRSLLQLFELYKKQGSKRHESHLPLIESASDLFLQVFELSLENEVNKFPPQELGLQLNQLYRLIELAISCVAFQMASRGYFRAIQGTKGVRPENVMQEIMFAGKEKFKNNRFTLKAWKWAKKILYRLVSNQWGIVAPVSFKTLAFQHRTVLEMHCANYLVSYANKDELKAIQKHVGDRAWENIWHAAIEMPLFDDGNLLLGADRVLGANFGPLNAYSSYRATLRTLFSRSNTDTNCRRPTRLMHEAIEWLNRAKAPSIFKQQLRFFAKELTDGLADELKELRENGTESQKTIARRLSRISTSSENSAYILVPNSNESRQPFYISKTPISNSEFQLFDPAQAKSGDESKEPNAPAILCSYHDAFVFSLFVGTVADENGRTFQASLPRSQHLMFCIRRLRKQLTDSVNGEFHVPTDIFVDLEANNLDLTEFNADRFGMVGLFNSGFEWCLHQKIEEDGTGHPWPNEYYVVPGLRPTNNRKLQNVIFRIVLE